VEAIEKSVEAIQDLTGLVEHVHHRRGRLAFVIDLFRKRRFIQSAGLVFENVQAQ